MTVVLILHADVYSAANGILVHLFQTSLTTRDYELLKCNCSRHFRGVSDQAHSAKSGLDIHKINQAFGRNCAFSAPQNVQAQAPNPYASYHQTANYVAPTPEYYYQTATYTANPASSYQAAPHATTSGYFYPPGTDATTLAQSYQAPPAAPPQVAAYSQNAGGLPVNLGGGAMITESRGVFISGLNYKAGHTELGQLFASRGLRPDEAKVHKDAKGKSKGWATAIFKTPELARTAVVALHDTEHMGMKLFARLDADATVIAQIGPLIVDGSKSSGVCTRESQHRGIANGT